MRKLVTLPGPISETQRHLTLGRILWTDLPLLNFAFYALSIAHAEIASLPNQRLDLVPTAVFPLLVPLCVYGLRFKTAGRRERAVAVSVLASVSGLVLIAYLFAPHSPVGLDRLRHTYEAGAILNTVLLMVHAWWASPNGRQGASSAKALPRSSGWAPGKDPARVMFFLGPAALYGLLLENGGILLGYFEELNYAVYLGPLPAPVATMSGWITVFYLVCWTTWELGARLPSLRRRPLVAAMVATMAALLLDLQIDPLASAVGFWRWHRSLGGEWMGVPVLNFVAWGCAVFPFAWLIFAREKKFGLLPGGICEAPHRFWLFTRIPAVLAVAAVMFLTVMAVYEGGFAGPTYKILGQAARDYGLGTADLTWRPGQ